MLHLSQIVTRSRGGIRPRRMRTIGVLNRIERSFTLHPPELLEQEELSWPVLGRVAQSCLFQVFTCAERGERLGGNPKLLGDVE